jgi:DNA invertase Pin-like site-specific DNA recombinase
MIALRLRAGRAKKADSGGFAGGAPPYGWQSVDGELVPDPHEQETLMRIRQLHDAGKPLRFIADTLNIEGVKPRRGRVWHVGVLGRLARKPSAERLTMSAPGPYAKGSEP